MRKVIIIGGGAAGLLASYASAISGNSVTLIEKNEKLGKKIYITGKGRCNLTNNVPVDVFLNNVVTNAKFLFSAMNTLSPTKTYNLFEELGLKLKTERGNRVFPISDKASDVTRILEKNIRELGVDVKLNTEVKSVTSNVEGVEIETTSGVLSCHSVIICTGGLSYPLTGSNGDGYKFAKNFGHSIIPLKPALVGLELKGNDFASMQGLSLKNVGLKTLLNGKVLYNDFGEMLFTHFGVSGPIILSCSSIINKYDVSKMSLSIDLKPAIDNKTLDSRLQRVFKENKSKTMSNVMRSLLPKSLIDFVLYRANIPHNKNCSEITQVERYKLVEILKNLNFEIKNLRTIDEAIVTSGGVSVKEINPKTMESKLVKNVYFAGEVLDIDAFTGGFNLQLAFSTGYVAGLNA